MTSYMTDYKTFTARDGAKLPYRHFKGPSDIVLIFLHGITEPSLYLREFGTYMSEQHLATVILPDLRGYGENPLRRGDIDYIGQLDDDIEDLIHHIQSCYPDATIIFGGHSAGGATALRQTIRPIHANIHAYLLISSALSPNSPLARKDGNNNESTVSIPKYALLMGLNAIGITKFNHTVVYRRLTPQDKLHGTETCQLSYRLAVSRMLDNQYENYLRQLNASTFVLVGEEDEVFNAHAYEPLYNKYTPAKVRVLADHDHDRIVKSEEALSIVGEWLQDVRANQAKP
ncbi:alpha/beta hydrolase [Paenibacillus anseongense]|uniref:alpha/beta hydrolase n=1 Tax=Paenibacillus anseongense TaxID=2682845 RepID=UPI002DBAFB38|nr:alpha/beta fold hydrolase [Paenibacillus anseongense]MEC0267105.1 alpha/beta fold hydrolase [Paenibacillus anseongense]